MLLVANLANKNDAKNLKNDWNPGYSSESTQQGLSNQYQHYRVRMVFKYIGVLVLWMKVASALEGLRYHKLAVYLLIVYFKPPKYSSIKTLTLPSQLNTNHLLNITNPVYLIITYNSSSHWYSKNKNVCGPWLKCSIINPLILRAAKNNLTILMKSCRLKCSWGNIWRRNVVQHFVNNSPSNIL